MFVPEEVHASTSLLNVCDGTQYSLNVEGTTTEESGTQQRNIFSLEVLNLSTLNTEEVSG